MDTEIQQWYCEACEKKYNSERKNEHLRTKVHEKNKKLAYRNVIYEVYKMYRAELFEEYKMRRNELMMEGKDVGDINFLGFLKTRIQNYKERKEHKKVFGRNYNLTE